MHGIAGTVRLEQTCSKGLAGVTPVPDLGAPWRAPKTIQELVDGRPSDESAAFDATQQAAAATPQSLSIPAPDIPNDHQKQIVSAETSVAKSGSGGIHRLSLKIHL